MSLREDLADWTDIDVAAHHLARRLGILPIESAMRDFKWVYWSNNVLGEALVRTLDEYVALGILERRDEPDLQYRWCTEYRKHVGLQ
jgi:hypothetical protein